LERTAVVVAERTNVRRSQAPALQGDQSRRDLPARLAEIAADALFAFRRRRPWYDAYVVERVEAESNHVEWLGTRDLQKRHLLGR
jgi:hypothetical protein